MNFIKKNIVFTLVAVITLLGAVFLIYLDWTRHDAISAANEVTQSSQKKFDDAFKKGNKPVELNIKMIQNDTEELKKRTVRLQRIFGKPYRTALLNFAASLKVTEDELYERMKKLYQKDTGTPKTAVALVPLLFEELEKEKKLPKDSIKNNEFRKFVADVLSETVEVFDTLESVYDILGVALGLERTMIPTTAKVYLIQLQNKILTQRLIPGVNSIETVQNFTFNQYVQTFPSNEAVRDILDMMPIYEDIFRRMGASRLERIEKFARTGSPMKINGNKYVVYNFSATVVGSMNSIRDFMNNLLAAYRDNRVYVISWVSLNSQGSAEEVEQVRNRLYGGEQQASGQTENAPPERDRGRPRRRSRPESRPAQIVGGRIFRMVSEEEAEEQPDYGAAVIGKNPNVTAVINFKYYKFVADMLKK